MWDMCVSAGAVVSRWHANATQQSCSMRRKLPSPTRRTFRDNEAERRQRLLPTVMRKKPLVVIDELERAHDLRAKLLGQLHYATGDEGK